MAFQSSLVKVSGKTDMLHLVIVSNLEITIMLILFVIIFDGSTDLIGQYKMFKKNHSNDNYSKTLF